MRLYDGMFDRQCIMYLNELYESEINYRISTFWDGGWGAELGDEMNGFKAEKFGFDTIGEAIKWLAEKAVELYPKSKFAEWWEK